MVPFLPYSLRGHHRPPPMQVILEAHAAMFVWLGARGDRDLLGTTCKKYSLHIGKKKILGQRHGLQNTTLTSCFFKNIYRKVIYINFYESIF